jgi:hypothetical protein
LNTCTTFLMISLSQLNQVTEMLRIISHTSASAETTTAAAATMIQCIFLLSIVASDCHAYRLSLSKREKMQSLLHQSPRCTSQSPHKHTLFNEVCASSVQSRSREDDARPLSFSVTAIVTHATATTTMIIFCNQHLLQCHVYASLKICTTF